MASVERQLLPGCPWRPWLGEDPPSPRHRLFGNETRDERGRVRVSLYKQHRFANSAGWQWRYRLVAGYALDDPLAITEHVDHVNGVIDDDRRENLRVASASYHGRYHAALVDVAGYRDDLGRFAPYDRPLVRLAERLGPIVSRRQVDGEHWVAVGQVLGCAR